MKTEQVEIQSYEIVQGNAVEVLKGLTTRFDCVVTSPPYYRQRIYGADSNELGRELSVPQYIANLVEMFKSIPLEPWASLWVNMGDKRGKHTELLGIPERFCIAMNDAGFHRIDTVIWAKQSVRVDGTAIGHGMIEPAKRRLNGNGYEPMYRFVLNPTKAWTDTCAVRIPRNNVEDIRYLPAQLMRCHTSIEGRNLGNVWNIPQGRTREAHHAVFPPALLERPIAMTCPLEITAQGPKSRIVETVRYEEARPCNRGIGKYSKMTEETQMKSGRKDTGRQYVPKKPLTIGWEPELPVIRKGIVLDPFSGTGTTGEVALKLGRNYIGIELYPNYAEISEERCRKALALRASYEEDRLAEDAGNLRPQEEDPTPDHLRDPEVTSIDELAY